MFYHSITAIWLVALMLAMAACGSIPADEISNEEFEDTSQEPADIDESDTTDIPSLTSCDAVATDCPNPVSLKVGDVFTVFFDYDVDGMVADEFSATGTSPQLGLSPVMLGAGGAGDRASIDITAHAAGDAALDVVIWYGEDRDIERTYSLAFVVVES